MKKLKHLKSFESLSNVENSGLYDQMSDLLSRASEIYNDFSGEEYNFDPIEAIESLEELVSEDPNYDEAQTLIGDIQDLESRIDEMDSEEYHNDGGDDEDYGDYECGACGGVGGSCEICDGYGRVSRHNVDISPD